MVVEEDMEVLEEIIMVEAVDMEILQMEEAIVAAAEVILLKEEMEIMNHGLQVGEDHTGKEEEYKGLLDLVAEEEDMRIVYMTVVQEFASFLIMKLHKGL